MPPHSGKTVYTSSKREISSLEKPLTALATEYYTSKDDTLVETLAKDYGLKSKSSWFFPQMLAKIAQCTPQKNSSGLISAKMLYDNYLSKNPILFAFLTLAKYPKRASLIALQTAEPAYCSLVPLIMSAFKTYKNISYESWDKSEVHLVVGSLLYDAMTSDTPDDVDFLVERELGLTIKTGVNAGGIRPPASTYALYFPHSSPLYSLPKFTQIMLCQTWCAHPSNRNKYMILDPNNWDNMPEPLISTEVLLPIESCNPSVEVIAQPGWLPWS